MWSWSEWSRFWIPGARSARIRRPPWRISRPAKWITGRHPELATFGEIARHILDASDGLTGMLLAGEENFTGADFRERLKPHMRALPADAGAAELAAGAAGIGGASAPRNWRPNRRSSSRR